MALGAALHGVQTLKPRLPDCDGGDSSRGSSYLRDIMEEGTEAHPKGDEVSRAFQDLITQLVQQHLLELREHNVGLSSWRSSRQTSDSSKRQQRALEEVILHKRKEVRKDLKEIHAQDILDIWTESIHSHLFHQPIQEALRKSTTSLGDTELLPEEYQNMTRLQKFQLWLESAQYEIVIGLVLCVNVLWMAFESQVYGSLSGLELGIYPSALVAPEKLPEWENTFQLVDLGFTFIFVLDMVVRIGVLRRRFWMVCMNYLDLAVCGASLVEITLFHALSFPVNPVLFRLFRIGKLARAFRMVTMTGVLSSLTLLVKCLASSSNMLFWSFCLLTFVQCVAGLIVSTLCRDLFVDEDYDKAVRDEVFRYYGTFTRTFLTMFEILFANWGPACRILTENITEYFSVFFLIYRCILGFAVLNVVNAVFVQQTMKTASSDEELAFKQKEKDTQMYFRKVKKLFQTIDSSGDGAICFEEFAKLVTSPKLQFWMSQLDLEYHDLLSLFEFLDNGDGEITIMEFIEGASRLRGGAKALDIWRIETKVEVLFEEVLSRLHHGKEEEVQSPESFTSETSFVQDAFDNSKYRHIKSTHHRSEGMVSPAFSDGLTLVQRSSVKSEPVAEAKRSSTRSGASDA